MAINPPSDIVLDVARAAAPLEFRAAVDKLARMGEGADAAADGFEAMLDAMDTASPAADHAAPGKAASDLDGLLRANARDRLSGLETAKETEPYRQFEAFVLQNFIGSMLPKDANHVFGDGIAGSYWSSMLAEQIAGQLAKAGGIGIASALVSSVDGAAVPVGSALSSLQGTVVSLERGFADSVLGTEREDDASVYGSSMARGG